MHCHEGFNILWCAHCHFKYCFGSLNKMCLGLWIQHLTSLMVIPFWDGNESQQHNIIYKYLSSWQSSTIKKLQKLTKKTHAKISSMVYTLCSSSATIQCILYLGSVDVYSIFFFFILVCGINDYARRGIAVLMSIVWVPKLKCNPLQ